MNNISPINRRIAKYRTLAGYTQETAAQALNMNKTTYARMERYGNPKPEILKSLAELFGVPVQNMLYGEPKPKEEPEGDDIVTLKEGPFEYKSDPPLTLTVNEKNCIKACRELSREKRSELMEYINNFYKENKGL